MNVAIYLCFLAPLQAKQLPQRTFCVEFDGKQSVLLTPLRFPANSATVEIQLRPKHCKSGTVFGNVDNSGVGIGLDNGFLYASMHDGRGYSVVKSNKRIAPNELVNVAAIFEQQQITLFVDGKLQGGGPKKLDRRRNRSKHALMIGADPDSKGVPQHFFSGTIFQVHLSKGALHKKDYKPAPEFKLGRRTVALYRFDEGVGIRVKDASRNKHHATLNHAKWIDLK